MIKTGKLCQNFEKYFSEYSENLPWETVIKFADIVRVLIHSLDTTEFNIKDDIAIHKSVKLGQYLELQGPTIINKDCFIGSYSIIRNGCFLGENVSIGPGSEVKNSLILDNTSLGHRNFIGDSILGSDINFEAGSLTANHFNEREDKKIVIEYEGETYDTGLTKFGALIGDGSKIGANAVINPGIVLNKNTIVERSSLYF